MGLQLIDDEIVEVDQPVIAGDDEIINKFNEGMWYDHDNIYEIMKRFVVGLACQQEDCHFTDYIEKFYNDYKVLCAHLSRVRNR